MHQTINPQMQPGEVDISAITFNHNRAVKKAAKACSYARKKDEHKKHDKKRLQQTRKSQKALLEAMGKLNDMKAQEGCLSPAHIDP